MAGVAGAHDFIFELGSDFLRSIEYLEEAGGDPVDLTGYEVRMQVRRTVGSATVLLELTTDNGRIVLTDASAGQFQLTVPASTHAGLDLPAPVDAVYDLELEAPGGGVVRLLEGLFCIRAEVTR